MARPSDFDRRDLPGLPPVFLRHTPQAQLEPIGLSAGRVPHLADSSWNTATGLKSFVGLTGPVFDFVSNDPYAPV